MLKALLQCLPAHNKEVLLHLICFLHKQSCLLSRDTCNTVTQRGSEIRTLQRRKLRRRLASIFGMHIIAGPEFRGNTEFECKAISSVTAFMASRYKYFIDPCKETVIATDTDTDASYANNSAAEERINAQTRNRSDLSSLYSLEREEVQNVPRQAKETVEEKDEVVSMIFRSFLH